jgi:hypothetical protein
MVGVKNSVQISYAICPAAVARSGPLSSATISTRGCHCDAIFVTVSPPYPASRTEFLRRTAVPHARSHLKKLKVLYAIAQEHRCQSKRCLEYPLQQLEVADSGEYADRRHSQRH